MMINKVMPLSKLECGNIFCVPHSLCWYMSTDTGYINLENGLSVLDADITDWENVLLLYERLGDIILDPEEDTFTYQDEWWAWA